MLSKLSNLAGVKVLSNDEKRDLKGGKCPVCLDTCCYAGTNGCSFQCYYGGCACGYAA